MNFILFILLAVSFGKIVAGVIILSVLGVVFIGSNRSTEKDPPAITGEPAQVLEFDDIPKEEIIPPVIPKKHLVDIVETELPCVLELHCNFDLTKHLDLGMKIYKEVYYLNLPENCKDFPPEFGASEPTYSFILKKVMKASWKAVLPSVRKVFEDAFPGDIVFTGFDENDIDLPNNINT